MQGLLAKCISRQKACAEACDDEMSAATIEGRDMTEAIDLLMNCRKGEVQEQIQAMRGKIKKLEQYTHLPEEKRRAVKPDALASW